MISRRVFRTTKAWPNRLERATIPLQQPSMAYIKQQSRSVSTGSLISDPLAIKNTRKVRDTNTRFPKPNFVSFDAFGTLYIPQPAVYEQYHEISSRLGFDTSLDHIKQAFPRIHKQMLQEFPNYGKHSTNITDPDMWWQELIRRLYGVEKSARADELCDSLIHRFKSSDGYYLFEDVLPTLSKLKENNIRIVVSTNSDTRVYDVLESLGVMEFVDREDIYISYNLLHEKPQKTFYDMVANSQIVKATGGLLGPDDRSSFLANCWHVGDTAEKDYIGSVKAGWNGVLLDRDVTSEYLTEQIPDPEADTPSCITKPAGPKSSKPLQIIANNRIIVSDLTQIAELFGF